MTIKVKYFGQIAEVTGIQEEFVKFNAVTVMELVAKLSQKYPDLEKKSFQMAQNKELVSLDSKVTGDEIAFLPPFAGG